MPLYRVQVTYETVVVAKDAREASKIALKEHADEGSPTLGVIHHVHHKSMLPPLWTPNCHPYGDDHNTIAYYLK